MNKIIIAFVAVSVLTLFSCSKNPDAVPKEKEVKVEASEVILTTTQYQTTGIVLGSIEERSMSGVLRASGVIDAPPQDIASISVPLGGFLKTLLIREGTHVRKGQPLATLENPEYIQLQQEYLEKYYQLEYLSAEYERQKGLAAENVSAQKVFQETTSRFHATEASVKGLRAKLQLLRINVGSLEKGTMQQAVTLSAPIDGYVIDMKANIGAYTSPTDILFKIVNTANMFVSITVFEKDLPSIAIGQKIRCVSPSNSGEFSGPGSFIGREIETDRSVRVQAAITNKGNVSLFKGMFVNTLIETGTSREVPVIASEAIVLSENKPHIFVLDSTGGGQYRFKMIEVQIGNTENGYSQILVPEGFPLGSKIVISGSSNLLASLKNTGEEE